VHHVSSIAATLVDPGALRGEVVGPVSHRDAADRVIVTGHPELGPERIEVVGHDAEKQAPSPSSTAVSSISSAASTMSPREYRLRYGAVLVLLFGRTTAQMHENYCFKCGLYTRIDDMTKLCRACYGYWPEAERPGR